MGEKRTLKCLICSYSVLTSGGPDMGFLAKTNTFICRDCEEIVDVTTHMINELKDSKKSVNKCSSCKGQNLILWNWNEKPCPKCGGQMRFDPEGISMNWD